MDLTDDPTTLERLLAEDAWLRRLAGRLVADPATADDLVQDTWTAALESPPADASRPRAWLGTVVRNLVRRGVRTDERRGRRERAAARPERVDDSPEAALVRAELRRRVANAVMDLDEPRRLVVVLRWFEGLSVREIAERTGLTEAAVRSRLRRALEQLRRRLDRDHDGDRRAWLVPLSAWIERGPVVPDAAPAALATSSVSPLAGAPLGGVLAMTVKTQVALLALVVAALVGLAVLVVDPFAAPPEPEVGAVSVDTAPSVASDDTAARRDRTERRPGDAATAPADPFADADRERDLHGVVRTAQGEPVPGAAVTALDASRRRVWLPDDPDVDHRTPGPSTQTDAEGRFRLRLAPAAWVDLRVEAEGYTVREIPGVAAGERVVVTLRPGVGARVTVRDESGRPVEGATVEVTRRPTAGTVTFRHERTTDADGTATLDGLPGGVQAWVRAEHEGLATAPLVSFTTPLAGRAEVEVVLPAGRRVAGVVLDDATGAPVADAVVGTSVRDELTTTDGRGAFVLPAVGAGDGAVRVRAEGFAPLEAAVGDVDDPEDLELRLVPERRLTGRIVAHDGTALGGVHVSAHGFRRGTSGFPTARCSAHAVTSKSGLFELGGLAPSLPLVLVAVAPGHGRTLLDLAPGGPDELGDVRLHPAHRLDVRVLWSDGTPAARVRVELVGANDDRSARLGPGDSRVSDGVGATEQRFTDDLGRVRLTDLSRGSYRLRVAPAGGEPVEQEVELREPHTEALVQLTGGERVEATVVTASGEPVVGVQVVVVDADGSFVTTATDRAGRATLHTEAAAAEIGVRPTGAAGERFLELQRRRLTPGERSVVLTLVEGEPLVARVVQPDDTPLASANLTVVERPGGLRRSALTGDDGSFRVLLTPGVQADVSLDGLARASLEDFARGVTQREVAWEGRWTGLAPRAEPHLLRVTALDRAPLRVRVLTPAGEPVAGARILTRLGHWMATGPEIRTDAAGRATVPGLPRRERRLLVDLDDVELPSAGLIEPHERSVVPGGEEIELVLRRALALTGRVVTDADTPASWSGVEVRTPDGERLAGATSEHDGSFRVLVPEDAPAELTVVAWTFTEDRRRLEGRVTHVAPGASGVVVRVE